MLIPVVRSSPERDAPKNTRTSSPVANSGAPKIRSVRSPTLPPLSCNTSFSPGRTGPQNASSTSMVTSVVTPVEARSKRVRTFVTQPCTAPSDCAASCHSSSGTKVLALAVAQSSNELEARKRRKIRTAPRAQREGHATTLPTGMRKFVSPASLLLGEFSTNEGTRRSDEPDDRAALKEETAEFARANRRTRERTSAPSPARARKLSGTSPRQGTEREGCPQRKAETVRPGSAEEEVGRGRRPCPNRCPGWCRSP
ncbi:MAG: hypothetical protein KatS3mg076_3145 [Candidatus Binatia bacterium]|nr:MAG: hypothetical protein KatS3mg076_3145 [Candidatus Binatia bacterium]